MNNEFKEKLHLYKEGKLNEDEIAEIEYEIDKFNAISDFLNNEDKELLEELKQVIPTDHHEVNRNAKLLKHRVNFRIILVTAITILAVLLNSIFLTFMASKIVSSLFGFDYKELYVERATMVQLAEIFHPQYESHSSSVETSLFAQQYIRVSLNNTVGNTRIDETEIRVKYSFGKPVRLTTAPKTPTFSRINDSSSLDNPESDPTPGFQVLEKAPQGTKAKILVEFNKSLTPAQLKESFIDQIDTTDAAPLEIVPMAAVDSRFILANPSYFRFTPVFPYVSSNAKRLEDRRHMQTQYESMDNQVHKESLVGNLKLIKDNQRLLQIMCNENMFYDVNMDEIIQHVENNGVEYIGMYISADREELLKLKDSPLIRFIRVENIVVW